MLVELRDLGLEHGFLVLQALDSLVHSVPFLLSLFVACSANILKDMHETQTYNF